MDAISTIIDTLSVGRDSKNDGGRKVKAILVIDMPHICDECMFSWETNEEWKLSCQLEHDLGTSKGKKPEWCPLKPMPMKREPKEEWLNEYHRDEFADGWNACLEVLENE